MKREKSDSLRKSISFAHFISLFLFQCIICSASIIGSGKGGINPYIACIIATFSLLSIIILAIEIGRAHV